MAKPNRLAQNHALYHNFMEFVSEKYPKIYKEYWDKRENNHGK